MKLFLRVAHAWAERAFAGRLAYRFGFFAGIFSTGLSLVALYYVSRLVPREFLAYGDYFTVTVIGMAFYGYVTGIANAPRQFITTEISSGTMETLMTLGPSLGIHFLAITFNQAIRIFFRAFFFVIIVAMLGWDVHLERGYLLIPIFLAGAAAGLGAGLIQTAIDIRTRAAGRVMGIVTGATALIAGVYFPVSFLPAPLRMLAEVIPAKHAVEGARVAMLNSSGVPLREYAMLGILAGILLLFGILSIRAALRVMKRDGTFLTY